VVLEVALDLLFCKQLALVVRGQRVQEIAVTHLGIPFFVFLGAEDFKYFLGAREESYFVFVVAADPVSPRSLALVRLLFLSGEVNGSS
jgi:hypothetical protein